MSKKLLFKGGHGTAMTPYGIEDFSSLHIRDPRIDEKTKAYIDSVIGNSVLNLCPYRNVLVTHKYDTVEGNVITLDDCQNDEIIQLSEIQGNTMVNCNKDTDKELILMPNLETNGYSNVTLTEGIDGGKVDISLEGNTMVNVCDQEETVAITKSYTVETGNHIALQGEYDGKCRPNIYGNTLVNLAYKKIDIRGNIKDDGSFTLYFNTDTETIASTYSLIKPSTTYTIVFINKVSEVERCYLMGANSSINSNISVITTPAQLIKQFIHFYGTKKGATVEEFQQMDFIILEGDYTNKPIPDYFTGMKSSFEDKLITDENDANNGKYKVDYKVTGKNKCNGHKLYPKKINTNDGQIINGDGNVVDFTRVKPNTKYITSINGISRTTNIYYYDINKNYIGKDPKVLATFTTPSNCYYTRHYYGVDGEEEVIQIEEGTTATTYEPYKEQVKTLYLNSPLLEGDTIEQSGNNIIHNHRYGKVVLDGSNQPVAEKILPSTGNYRWSFIVNDSIKNNDASTGLGICNKYPVVSPDDTWKSIEGITQNNASHRVVLYLDKYKDGSDTSKQALINELSANPITFIYKKETPAQEIIATNDNLLLDSYTNGHLDVDTVVPIDKVVFNDTNLSLKYLYPNIAYTIQFESDNVGKIDYIFTNGATTNENSSVVKGLNKFTLTTPNEILYNDMVMCGIGFNASKIVVTPKVDNDFGYFKGMKSVGECEGNKIEILSQNKNLFDGFTEEGNLIGNPPASNLGKDIPVNYMRRTTYINVQGNTQYIVGNFVDNSEVIVEKVLFFDIYKKAIQTQKTDSGVFTTPTNCSYIRITFKWRASHQNAMSQSHIDNSQVYLLKENVAPSQYTKGLSNKKEILLSEPLRGLPNGIRDKYVIIDGKWYIKRNCKEVILNGSETWQISTQWISSLHFWCRIEGKGGGMGRLLCDKNNEFYGDGYYWTDNIIFKNDVSNFNNIEEFKTWLQTNQPKVLYRLETPIYEEITDVELITYLDTTHISNNSTIPCNMVIRNTGFNCILKPNTTYTVSSSNGLSSVTTKDSIGDSILRFYDKDTTSVNTMKNVLVLEGDYITGNPPIPAFFKGMESAFEQELVTDENDEHYGKYKVEVLANNGNLFDIDTYESGLANIEFKNNGFRLYTTKPMTYANAVFRAKIKPFTDYRVYADIKITKGSALGDAYDTSGHWFANTLDTFNSKNNTELTIRFYCTANVSMIGDVEYTNIRLIEVGHNTNFVENKHNKIQFFLNEPLRGVGDIKDKVYVKEDKIVVERNCSSITFDGSDDENWGTYNNVGANGSFCITIKLPNKMKTYTKKGYAMIICNKLPYIENGYTLDSTNISTYVMDKYSSNNIYVSVMNAQLKSKDKQGVIQWVQANPITVTYQLATPVYEEVECDLSKLALEGYNHGTLFYNSNIPVTTQFYDFNVNIKDMLIPNETYYVTFIADRVKDITINLSGVQVNYKTSMGYNKVPIQLGDVVSTNFSMDSKGVELNDLMISTSTSLIYVKDMNDVCIYDEATNKYSITITSTDGNESDKRVILLDYPLLRLNKDVYDRLYYNNKDSRYRIDKKVFKHKFTNDREYSKYAAETNDTYYSSFISFDESIKDYVVITNEKVKTVKVEDDKYYFKIKWSDLGVSDKTEVNGNQGMKDFFNNNEVHLYYATDGFVEIVDGLRRQTLKMYQPETTINFLGNTTTTVTIIIPKKNI